MADPVFAGQLARPSVNQAQSTPDGPAANISDTHKRDPAPVAAKTRCRLTINFFSGFGRCGFTIRTNVKVARKTGIVLDKKRYFRSMVTVRGLSAQGPCFAAIRTLKRDGRRKTDRGLIEAVSQPSSTEVAAKKRFK